MKSSCPHSRSSSEPEALSLREHQPELVRLFGDILDQGLTLRFKATGRSMKPFLRGGEVLTIRQTPSRGIRSGDLILFKSRHQVPVVHRVLRRKATAAGTFSFVTKGDALKFRDEEIHEDSVLGRVESIEKPALAAGTVCVNLNGRRQRCLNFVIAVVGFLTTQAALILFGCLRKVKLVTAQRGEYDDRRDHTHA